MLRHYRNQHGSGDTPPLPVPAVGEQPPSGPFLFRHPFTMIVSGPTSCGKTHFVTEILREAEAMCEPAPQRIVWLYKRWQPLYDVVRDGVYPPVEFVRGIPTDLEIDFFDPRVRNVVVLDDLMSLASKDTRINVFVVA